MSTFRKILLSQKKVVKSSGGGGGGSFTLVQTNYDTGLTVSFPSNITAGDTIVVSVSSFGSEGSGCTDNLGNTYVALETIHAFSTLVVYVATNVVGGACTVTIGGTPPFADITVAEYSGVTSVESHNSVSGTNPSLPIVTTATTMFFAGWCNQHGVDYTSATLNPVGVAGTVISHNAGQSSATFEWLNAGVGFPAGSYTADLVGADAWIIIALK